MHPILAPYQIGMYGKIGTRSDPGVLVTPGVRHQGVSLMRPDDTAPDGAVLIPLRARDGSARAYAIVDAADADWVNRYRWSLGTSGYAARTTGRDSTRRGYLMHREVLGLVPGDGLEGDHINRNRLDNRRENLRAVPKRAQQQNLTSKGKTSKYRGVHWYARKRKWRACITVSGKTRVIGQFDSEVAAAEAARAERERLMPYATD